MQTIKRLWCYFFHYPYQLASRTSDGYRVTCGRCRCTWEEPNV